MVGPRSVGDKTFTRRRRPTEITENRTCNNTWIEILHTAVPTELQGDWVFKLPGTNVWFNVGRTIVFCCAGDHGAAIKFLAAGCSQAASSLV